MKKIASYAVLMALSAGVTWLAVSHYDLTRDNERLRQERQRASDEAEAAAPSASSATRTSSSSVNEARRKPQPPQGNPPGSAATIIDSAGQPPQVPPAAPLILAAPLHAVATAPAPVAGAIRTPAWIRYEQTLPGQGSKCRIDGTSTIHDWTMESPIIAGWLEVDARATFDPHAKSVPFADGIVPARGEVRIPVRTLKSASARMDEAYKTHMEEPTYKSIGFRLLQLQAAEHAPGAPWRFEASGPLAIHGVTNLVALTVTIEHESSETLKISGQAALRMSDYGVVAPAPTLDGFPCQIGDGLTVTFTWVVSRRRPVR